MEVMNLIDYSPLWNTMDKKKITKYQLIYHYNISSNTLRRIRNGEAITTETINTLCLILNCKVQDIISFNATEEEKSFITNNRNEIQDNKNKS